MFLNLTNERKKEVQLMITDYNLTHQTIIKQIYPAINELVCDAFKISEISSILKHELNLTIKPNTLQKILKRLDTDDKPIGNKNKEDSSVKNNEKIQKIKRPLRIEDIEIDIDKCPF